MKFGSAKLKIKELSSALKKLASRILLRSNDGGIIIIFAEFIGVIIIRQIDKNM